MAVTESTSATTNGQSGPDGSAPRRHKRLLDRGTWTELGGVLVALLAVMVTVFGIKFYGDDEPAKGSNATAVNPPARSATTVPPGTAPPPGATSPQAGVALDTLSPVGGRAIPLPGSLDRSKYPNAVAIGCPSNQTGDDTATLKYDLFRRYHGLTATITGWSHGNEPFGVRLRVFAGTQQPDDQMLREQRLEQAVTVNGAAAPIRIDLAAAGDAGRDGAGADQLELEIACDQPHDVVILADAVLTR
jgi:hypothetical protein